MSATPEARGGPREVRSESAPHAMLTGDGKVRSWGPGIERFSGIGAPRVLGRDLSEVLVALEPEQLPAWPSLAAGERWSGLAAFVTSDAQSGKVPSTGIARCWVLPTGDGISFSMEPLPHLGKRLGEESEPQRLAVLLEGLPGFCYSVDTNLVFTSSLGAGLSRLNLRPGELVGKSLSELWGTNDPRYEPLACHLRALAGHTQSYEDACMGRSLEYRLHPERDREGRVVGVIGVGIDVTEREAARSESARLVGQLRQAQKLESLGRLAGGVAHDFNNLLTCMMGNLALAWDQVAPGSPAQRHLLAANAAVESAATLTRQLLAFGRKQVIDPRPINLSALIERVRGMLERLIGESIVLRTSCANDLWSVRADPGQLEQVLVNLIVNARDAITANGEIVLATSNHRVLEPEPTAFSSLEAGDYVVLSVRDNGRGMSELVRARLFEPFFTTKELGAGSGLGLATVYGAVEQNGGRIAVESELGHGTCFRIYLPRVAEAAVSDTEQSTPAPSALVRGGNETILLVEDEPLVLELAQCTLEQLGYRVLACSGPDQALHCVSGNPGRIDLLLTDVVMPRMNGKALAARVRAFLPEIRVLYTSGYGESIIARQGVVEAGLEFLPKPYRPSELSHKVRALLDQARPGHPNSGCH